MDLFSADEPAEPPEAEPPAGETEPPAATLPATPTPAEPARSAPRASLRVTAVSTGALLRGFWRLPGRAQLHVGLLAVVMTVVVVALVMLGPGPDDRAGLATAAVFPPTASTPPAPQPMSAASYQTLLSSLGVSIGSGLTLLGAAHSPPDIALATSTLRTAVVDALGELANSPPPRNVAAANTALINALEALSGEGGLSPLLTAADRDTVCLGSSATALLSRSTGMAELRTAITRLTGNGTGRYHLSLNLPPVTQDTARALATGAVVDGARGHGLGELAITNGGTVDATVGLVPDQGGKPVVTVYVGHGQTYTLHGVPDGTYQVYVMTGTDWDSGAVAFSRDCDFWRFDQTMRFVTTSRIYTTYTITLTSVPNGTATSTEVDPGSFPR